MASWHPTQVARSASAQLGIDTNANDANAEPDIIYQGEEDIDAFGGDGVDTLSAAGGAGTGQPLDTPIAFEGGGGADVITGGPRGDSITGGEGPDSLRGGDGDDLLDGSAGDDLLAGDAGSDSVRFQTAATGATLDLAVSGPQNTIAAGFDTLQSVENASGTCPSRIRCSATTARTSCAPSLEPTRSSAAGALTG